MKLSVEEQVNMVKDLDIETMADLVIELFSQMVECGVDREVMIERIRREII